MAQAESPTTPVEASGGQEDVVEYLVVNARSLRHKAGNLLVVFEGRDAVWRGLERALRIMQTWEEGRQRVNIRAYAICPDLRRALAKVQDESGRAVHSDYSFAASLTYIFDRWWLTGQREHLRAVRSVLDEGWSRRGSPPAPETEETTPDGTQVIREVLSHMDDSTLRAVLRDEEQADEEHTLAVEVLEGHRIDEELWRFDQGIIDEESGCPDEELRGRHKSYVESGTVNIRGICFPCPRRKNKSCGYMRNRLPGAIVNHPGKDVFGPAITALFGDAIGDSHGARRASRSIYLQKVRDQLGEESFRVLRRVLDGEHVPYEQIKTVARGVEQAHLEAALALGQLKEDGKVLTEGDRETRNLWRDIRTIFRAGAWYAKLGAAIPEGDPIVEPVVDAPLKGHFIAFPDNIEAWRPHLEPVGAVVVDWRGIEAEMVAHRSKTDKRAKPNMIEEMVATAATIILEGGSATQQAVADRLGISVATVKDRCYTRGVPWKVVKNQADMQADAQRAETQE